MKIGILTFHNANNYGAVLQTYALYTRLCDYYGKGNVFVIDYDCKTITDAYRLFRYENKKRFILHELLYFFASVLYIPQNLKCKINFDKFRKNFKLSKDSLDSFDVIFYGSDQIWRPDLTGNDLVYFGKNYSGKKIAYGASDGGKLDFKNNNCKNILSLINQFSAISCREKSLVERLKIFVSKDILIENVCDPVFLLDSKNWKSVSRSPKEKSYVLIYKVAFNESIDKDALHFAKDKGKELIEIIPLKGIRKFLIKTPKYKTAIDVPKFLGYFANADYIFTTSFHGTAFSIIFRKNFYTFKFKSASERITDLFDNLNLQSRFVNQLPKNIENVNYSNEFENKYADFVAKSNVFITKQMMGGGAKRLVFFTDCRTKFVSYKREAA